jgi:hypothetical protein
MAMAQQQSSLIVGQTQCLLLLYHQANCFFELSSLLLPFFISSSLCSIQCSSSSQPSFLMGFLGRPTITMVHFNFQGNFEHFLNFAKKTIKCLLQSLQRVFFGEDPIRISLFPSSKPLQAYLSSLLHTPFPISFFSMRIAYFLVPPALKKVV